jgi:hypothetical protein
MIDFSYTIDNNELDIKAMEIDLDSVSVISCDKPSPLSK